MTIYKTIRIDSKKSIELIDITKEAKDYITESLIKSGIFLIYTPHTTAGITINENADPAVRGDIENFLKKNFPHEPYFKHMEGNSPSHLMSSYFTPAQALIIENNQLVLGTWQGIFFCEFDGPRRRKVFFKIIKDH